MLRLQRRKTALKLAWDLLKEEDREGFVVSLVQFLKVAQLARPRITSKVAFLMFSSVASLPGTLTWPEFYQLVQLLDSDVHELTTSNCRLKRVLKSPWTVVCVNILIVFSTVQLIFESRLDNQG